MAKEWILNQAMNRWGLNKKRSVGPVSELIRKCAPRKLEDWERYYYGQLQDILGMLIEPATDEMDRIYNVDFVLKIKGELILNFNRDTEIKNEIKRLSE